MAMNKKQKSDPPKRTNVRSSSFPIRALRTLLPIAYRIVPRKIEKLALRQFRTPRPHHRPGREEKWLATAQRFAIPIRPPAGADVRAPDELAGWAWGSGPTVLLVHGWEGRGSQMGAFVAPLTAAGYRVVTFDSPAHGESGGKLSSLPEMTNALEAAAHAAGPLHGLVAHSFGCAAAALAVHHGLRVERLAFVSPPADFGGFLLRTVHAFGLPDQVYDTLTQAIERRFHISWEAVRRITMDAATEIPLLVAHDRGDPETSYEGGLRVHRAWPSSRLLTTDGLGHRRILRNRNVAEQVARFIAKARSDTGSNSSPKLETELGDPIQMASREPTAGLPGYTTPPVRLGTGVEGVGVGDR